MKNKTNLLNPTPSQVKYRNRKWAEALQSSKKCRDLLYLGEKRCCLGVACDVAHSMYPKMLEDALNQDDNLVPSRKVAEFYGWPDHNPDLGCNMLSPICAAELNDGETSKGLKPKSHKQIAECVLNTFVRPKNPVWKLNKRQK